jgi:hypothetical protein
MLNHKLEDHVTAITTFGSKSEVKEWTEDYFSPKVWKVLITTAKDKLYKGCTVTRGSQRVTHTYKGPSF